jgi:flagellar protein FlaF
MTVIPLRRPASESTLAPAIDIESFRDVTAALARCAMEVPARAANDSAETAERHERLARTVHANMELWAAVLHAALDGASGLPKPLRTHLVELAEVSIRHGAHVLRGDAAVDPLIAVNRSVIDGLQLTDGNRASITDR